MLSILNDNAARQRATTWGLMALAVVVLLMWPNAAWASESGGGLPYESFLGNIRESLTGVVGYTFALAGIVVAGGMLVLGGDLNGFVRTLLLLVLVISLLVGANAILASISGGGATIAAAVPVNSSAGLA